MSLNLETFTLNAIPNKFCEITTHAALPIRPFPQMA